MRFECYLFSVVVIIFIACDRDADNQMHWPMPSSVLATGARTDWEPEDRSSIDISFGEEQLTIGNTVIGRGIGVEELSSLLGPPDRMFDKANVIYVWDRVGIIAYRKHSAPRLHSVTIAFKDKGYDFSPRTNFAGSVIFDAGTINAAATSSGLENCGLSQDKDLPFLYVLKTKAYMVIAETEESLVSVSFNWSGE